MPTQEVFWVLSSHLCCLPPFLQFVNPATKLDIKHKNIMYSLFFLYLSEQIYKIMKN